MKTIKKITFTLLATFLISFSNKMDAKNFYIANDTEENYWITYVYENGDSTGKIFRKDSSLLIKPINFTPIGEGNGSVDTSELKEIYIFESSKDVKFINGKLTNFIVKTNLIELKNNEAEIEIIQLDTGKILIEATQD